MSVLDHRPRMPYPSPLPSARDWFDPDLRNSISSGPDPLACLCGARLSLPVRLGLKSRTRPVLDGRWCCSEACLRARVASFVRLGFPTPHPRRQHRHRVPLGLLLLQSGSITQEQLRHALHVSQHSEERVGQVLVRDCGLPEHTLAGALAQQWGCGSWDLRGIRPDVAACCAPLPIQQRTGMVPVRQLRDGQIGVAFDTDLDAQAIFAVQRIHDRPVEAGIAMASQVAEARTRIQQATGVSIVESQCAGQAQLVREVVRTIVRLQPVESRWARVYNMFWLRLWLEPAALLGGLTQREDVADHIFYLPVSPTAESET